MSLARFCFRLAEDAPPTILIRIPSGSASVEPGGELAVFPGSTVHLECLFSRRIGSPDWTWTSPLGQYLTGKANNPFHFLYLLENHRFGRPASYSRCLSCFVCRIVILIANDNFHDTLNTFPSGVPLLWISVCAASVEAEWRWTFQIGTLPIIRESAYPASDTFWESNCADKKRILDGNGINAIKN